MKKIRRMTKDLFIKTVVIAILQGKLIHFGKVLGGKE